MCPSPALRTQIITTVIALTAALVFPRLAGGEPRFRRGDANQDSSVNISDPVFTLDFLFLGNAEPGCLDAMDGDDSGKLEISDPITILNFLFQGVGPIPPPGHVTCGEDPTPDGLDCASDDQCPPISSGDPVVDALTALSISTAASPRLGPDQQPLPGDYSPLGPEFAVNRTREIFYLGIVLDQVADSRASIARLLPDGPFHAQSFLYTPPGSQTPWAAAPLRTAAAGDIDGDGLDEVAVISIEGGDVKVYVLDQETLIDASIAAPATVARLAGVRRIAAGAGNFDGGGPAEIAVVLTTEAFHRILIVSRRDGDFAVTATWDVEPGPGPFGGSLKALLAVVDTGNLDADPADELALALTDGADEFSFGGTGSSPPTLARLYVHDDADSSFAERKIVAEFTSGGEFEGSQIAGVSVGDVDGDGSDEVVFGRVVVVNSEFEPPSGTVFALVLDDGGQDFRTLSSFAAEVATGSCCSDELPYLHVNTPDMDGDGAAEIVLNSYVFEASGRLRHNPPFFNFLDLTERDKGAVGVGDVTGDGKDEIIIFRADSSGFQGRVYILRDRGDLLLEVTRDRVDTTLSFLPVILTANLDGSVLDYARSRQVWTQPVVNAVLAAPPCRMGIGQRTDVCTTSFGVSRSHSGSIEETFTVSMNNHIGFGFDVEVLGVEAASAEIKLNVSSAMTTIDSSAYTLTKSIIYTAGENEDAVILTTLPFDQYIYEITAHTDSRLIGEEVIVSLPREPVTIMVERGFYNERVAQAGDVKVDDLVLQHTIGDLSTYPKARRNELLAQWNGLHSDVATVGPGGGEVEVGITFDEETTRGYAFEVGASLEVNTSALGIMRGFTIGVTTGSTVTYSKGKSSDYRGKVGQIDPESFPQYGGYSFGLFTYTYEDAATGQQFEVVDYWVE